MRCSASAYQTCTLAKKRGQKIKNVILVSDWYELTDILNLWCADHSKEELNTNEILKKHWARAQTESILASRTQILWPEIMFSTWVAAHSLHYSLLQKGDSTARFFHCRGLQNLYGLMKIPLRDCFRRCQRSAGGSSYLLHLLLDGSFMARRTARLG
jgi:hypothetical protein